jgi:uncharacterized RDD family membrane protein YckC/ribosomal protein L40E
MDTDWTWIFYPHKWVEMFLIMAAVLLAAFLTHYLVISVYFRQRQANSERELFDEAARRAYDTNPAIADSTRQASVCSTCGARLPNNATLCELCGSGEISTVVQPYRPAPAPVQRGEYHCASCGARIGAAGARCEWCGSGEKSRCAEATAAYSAINEDRWHRTATDSVTPVVYMKAPLGRRYLALLVDAFIATGPGISGVALIAIALSLPGLDRSNTIAMAAMFLMFAAYLLMGVGLLWFFVYFFLKDAWKNGSSIGKRLFGLMVISVATNQPCGRWQSILRTTGYFLPLTQMIDPLAVLQDARGRRVGDHIAGTQVIAAADYAGDRRSDWQPSSALRN